jgi:hypothetical protein
MTVSSYVSPRHLRRRLRMPRRCPRRRRDLGRAHRRSKHKGTGRNLFASRGSERPPSDALHVGGLGG